MKQTKVSYIISDIDKALAFEWISERVDQTNYQISYILILQKPAHLEQFLNKRGILCYTFYYRSKKDFVLLFWKVFKALKSIKPDVVHCHLLYGSLIGLTAAWLVGVDKRIYTRHHSDYHHRYFPKGIKLDMWCNRLATLILAPSSAVKEVLIKYEKVSQNKVKVVHHGFDLDYFKEVSVNRVTILKEKYCTYNHYPIIGVISRFTELKGIQFIIPAFKSLLKSYPKALLLLFNARGDYERTILDLLMSIPQENYRLIPFENDLSAVYRLFDVFVQASTDRTIEAFGQTYVEALAAGVPSIFTLSGIAPDFIKHKKNALVVPYRNSEAIYKAILEILHDETQRQKLIANGFTSIEEKFDLHVMIKKLEESYAGA